MSAICVSDLGEGEKEGSAVLGGNSEHLLLAGRQSTGVEVAQLQGREGQLHGGRSVRVRS